jgi:hypothetical protein
LEVFTPGKTKLNELVMTLLALELVILTQDRRGSTSPVAQKKLCDSCNVRSVIGKTGSLHLQDCDW